MGMITNIQRCSIHDGPGIRTTVFLKGCPLRCAWCHNPENLHAAPETAWYGSRCVRCGQCATACPQGAIALAEDSIHIDRTRCKACFQCVSHCPGKALTGFGKDVSVDELVEAVLRDRRYYERSGGGVTFSGGEPLMQPDFVLEAAKRFKAEGLHTAMETSCYAKSSVIRAVAPYINYFMVDIKAMDSVVHRQYTGVDNSLILDSIALLSELGAEALIRVPVATGVNDTAENMYAMADFLLTRTSFRRVELLRMHKLAQSKYDALARPYAADAICEPEEAHMHQLAKSLTSRGITVIYAGKEVEPT